MTRRWCLVSLVVVVLSLGVGHAVAQNRLRTPLPSDSEAARMGMVRRWYGFAPVDGVREKIESVMVVGDHVHLQTNASRIHAMDAETGRLLWSAQLGRPAPGQLGSAINSTSVFAISGTSLYHLNRQNGSRVWSVRLPQVPSAEPAADEGHVMVSTADGRIYVYDAETHEVLWFYQTNAPVSMPALLMDDRIACASEDGWLYVFQISSRNPVLRFGTGAPVSAPMAGWGRLVLVASRDYHLYAVDIRTGETRWRYTAGAEIHKPVTVVNNDVFLTPEDWGLHVLNAETGERRWWYPRAQQFVSASKERVYATDKYGQLLILDRSNGRVLGTWDLHDFDLWGLNERTDRVYLVSQSGMVVCLHEKGNEQPVIHEKVLPPPAPSSRVGPMREAPAAAPASEP